MKTITALLLAATTSLVLLGAEAYAGEGNFNDQAKGKDSEKSPNNPGALHCCSISYSCIHRCNCSKHDGAPGGQQDNQARPGTRAGQRAELRSAARARSARRGALGAVRFRDRRKRTGAQEATAEREPRLARRFDLSACSASSAFNAALARCSLFAAPSSAVRVFAASSSASASRSFRVQNRTSSMPRFYMCRANRSWQRFNRQEVGIVGARPFSASDQQY
jgi:hypothetical protein